MYVVFGSENMWILILKIINLNNLGRDYGNFEIHIQNLRNKVVRSNSNREK